MFESKSKNSPLSSFVSSACSLIPNPVPQNARVSVNLCSCSMAIIATYPTSVNMGRWALQASSLVAVRGFYRTKTGQQVRYLD